MILALQYSTQGVKMIMCNVQAMIYHCILPTVTYQNYYLKLHRYHYTTQSGSTIYIWQGRDSVVFFLYMPSAKGPQHTDIITENSIVFFPLGYSCEYFDLDELCSDLDLDSRPGWSCIYCGGTYLPGEPGDILSASELAS